MLEHLALAAKELAEAGLLSQPGIRSGSVVHGLHSKSHHDEAGHERANYEQRGVADLQVAADVLHDQHDHGTDHEEGALNEAPFGCPEAELAMPPLKVRPFAEGCKLGRDSAHLVVEPNRKEDFLAHESKQQPLVGLGALVVNHKRQAHCQRHGEEQHGAHVAAKGGGARRG